MTRVVLAGASGRLGSLLDEALGEAQGLQCVGRLRRGDDLAAVLEDGAADVLLDVTLAEASRVLVPAALERGLDVVLGTSGCTSRDLGGFHRQASELGRRVLHVPNFSLGAVLQMEAAEQAGKHLGAGVILEVHHPTKKDSPSGTALATADRIFAASESRPPITSERRDGVIARQTVSWESDGERYEIVHEVTQRSAFVPGAMLAVRGVSRLEPGLTTGLQAVLDLAER